MNSKCFFVVLFLVLFLLNTSFTSAPSSESNDNEFVVVLDAGHGGHDPGNLGNGYLEKNIALNIVLKVGSILEKNPNVKVIYTRNDDTFVDLFVRGEIANKANADLFVSVHCDSHTSDAHGAGTFVLGLHANKQNFEIAKKENQVIYLEDNYESRYANYDINSPESVIGLTIMQEEFLDQSISLAKAIQDNFTKKLKRKNREVKQAGFIVLHQTFMPSVLVETGFLTNDDEGAYLNSKSGQVEMGTAIANAILTYKNGVDASAVSLSTQTATRAPDPTTITKPVSKTEPKPAVISTKDAEEEFAKNPGESPIAENSSIQNSSEEITEVLKEAPKTVVDAPAMEMEEEKISNTPKPEAIVKESTNSPVIEVIKTEEPTRPKIEAPVVRTSNVIFKVQLMASAKTIPLEPRFFKGLETLSKEPVRNLYRYMYGSVNSYSEALNLKSNADIKGYTTSYIVAYKDGERIPTPEARKLVSE